MPLDPTRYSRVSIGWVTSTKSIRDMDAGDTGKAFSVTGGADFLKSTLSVDGAATFGSTVTAAGQITATGGVAIGGGANIVALSTGTVELDFANVTPLESSSVLTFGVSGLTRGDALSLYPDALWPVVAAQRDLSIFCSSSSTVGEAHAWVINSTLTAVNAAAHVFRWERKNFASYL